MSFKRPRSKSKCTGEGMDLEKAITPAQGQVIQVGQVYTIEHVITRLDQLQVSIEHLLGLCLQEGQEESSIGED